MDAMVESAKQPADLHQTIVQKLVAAKSDLKNQIDLHQEALLLSKQLYCSTLDASAGTYAQLNKHAHTYLVTLWFKYPDFCKDDRDIKSELKKKFSTAEKISDIFNELNSVQLIKDTNIPFYCCTTINSCVTTVPSHRTSQLQLITKLKDTKFACPPKTKKEKEVEQQLKKLYMQLQSTRTIQEQLLCFQSFIHYAYKNKIDAKNAYREIVRQLPNPQINPGAKKELIIEGLLLRIAHSSLLCDWLPENSKEYVISKQNILSETNKILKVDPFWGPFNCVIFYSDDYTIKPNLFLAFQFFLRACKKVQNADHKEALKELVQRVEQLRELPNFMREYHKVHGLFTTDLQHCVYCKTDRFMARSLLSMTALVFLFYLYHTYNTRDS